MGLPEEAKGSNHGQEGAGHKSSPAHQTPAGKQDTEVARCL